MEAQCPRAAAGAFPRFAYEEDWFDEPVTARIPRVEQKRMEVLSREDMRKVLRVCGTCDRALVMTLIDSGLRRGQALALEWEDTWTFTHERSTSDEGRAEKRE